ncbi:unnamed protein product [Parnassius apollo]|uniref:(apollo) hypothetical protein n=1 Tax=Parnassius apollo TaxID=110799 RepID=A0A8S3W5L8_PARAO|nr:unnamed protein product [Parnassius apollo]
MDAQSQRVARWLEETDEEEENDLEDLPSSEDEEDCCLEERHDSESEQESDVGEQIIPDTPSALQPLSESSSDEDVPLANLRIYKSKSGLEWQATPYRTSRKSRRDYLRSVAIELIKAQMRQRLMTKNLPRTIKEKIMMFLEVKESNLVPEDEVIPKKRTKTARCYDCGRAKDRSSRTFCQKCQKPVCNDHKYPVCLGCYNKYVTEPKE